MDGLGRAASGTTTAGRDRRLFRPGGGRSGSPCPGFPTRGVATGRRPACGRWTTTRTARCRGRGAGPSSGLGGDDEGVFQVGASILASRGSWSQALLVVADGRAEDPVPRVLGHVLVPDAAMDGGGRMRMLLRGGTVVWASSRSWGLGRQCYYMPDMGKWLHWTQSWTSRKILAFSWRRWSMFPRARDPFDEIAAVGDRGLHRGQVMVARRRHVSPRRRGHLVEHRHLQVHWEALVGIVVAAELAVLLLAGSLRTVWLGQVAMSLSS